MKAPGAPNIAGEIMTYKAHHLLQSSASEKIVAPVREADVLQHTFDRETVHKQKLCTGFLLSGLVWRVIQICPLH